MLIAEKFFINIQLNKTLHLLNRFYILQTDYKALIYKEYKYKAVYLPDFLM